MSDLKAPPVPLPSDDRYRLLVEAITDYAIYMLDPEGRITSWNPGAQRFKGYASDEIIGEHFSRFYTPQDREAGVPEAALRTATQEGRFEAEGWRVRKDGTRFWANVVIDPIRAPSGDLLGFAKITRDLTERRAAEESLRLSEESFRLLVQGVTDYAVYMLDPQGRVTNWNAGAQRIKGYAPDEVIGEHFSRFYTEEDRAAGEPARALAAATAAGRFEKEGVRVRKDGTRFWAHVIIDAIRSPSGDLIGFAKITRDITERRDAQEALEKAREALFQSQKLEAIGQLTGGVAHDFNNLLMAILGSLELVRKRLPHDAKVTPLIDNAVMAAERGAALTQRMLAFARKQELAMRNVDLPSLVRGLSELLRGSLGPSITLEMRFPAGLPPIHTDPGQLESAVINLAVNARDAMPSGGTISISAKAEALPEGSGLGLPAGDYVRLAVTDTGEGMDADTLARAAEPFFTTKGIGKGTGLGLSMAHGLAEQSGGRLKIESAAGRGTTVTFWFPQATAGDEVQVFTGAALENSIAPTPQLVILAVDDDKLVRLNMVAMLEDLGHRVFPASSAGEAMAILRAERIDLVITDYAMPQITGLQLAAQIKLEAPDLPVILATGYAELSAGEETDLPRLAKPFFQQDLANVIRRAIAVE
jgi:PAS domain S-box-containing protein